METPLPFSAGGGEACSLACSVAGSALELCVSACATPLNFAWTDFVEPCILICVSAAASGLTLGLMSLDTSGLQIIVAGGEEPDRSRAEKILPLRQRGNQLLCTLLLLNTLVNARLSIFMGQVTSGVIGGLVATGLIVIFGEIIPQATCSRHALAIGALCVEPMKVVLLVLSPVTWPMSKVLDFILGDEIASGHTKREIEHLLRMQDSSDQAAPVDSRGHSAEPTSGRRGLSSTEKKLLGGVLLLSEKTAQDVMTDFDNIFMIDYAAKLDFCSLREIYRSGYTRVPVYHRSRNNLVGVLNTKDLVLVDADDELPVCEIMGACGRPIFTVSHNTPLDKMLNCFKLSRTHLALVQRLPEAEAGAELESTVSISLSEGPGGPSAGLAPGSSSLADAPDSHLLGAQHSCSSDRHSSSERHALPQSPAQGATHKAQPLAPALAGAVGLDFSATSSEGLGRNLSEPVVLMSSGGLSNIVGIVTLEDVLEELLQAEIVDENDCVEDNVTLKSVEGRLKELADRRFAFLDMLQHQPRSSMMTTSVGQSFETEIRMTHTELAAVCSFLSGNAVQFSPSVLSQEMLLTLIMQCKVCDVLPGTPASLICKRKSPCVYAYLVLQGRVRVIAGEEGFKTEFGPWTLLAAKSLEDEVYSPDFSANVVEHARLLLISAAAYRQLARSAQDLLLASEMINIGKEEESSSDSEGNGAWAGVEMNRLSGRRTRPTKPTPSSAIRQLSAGSLRKNSDTDKYGQLLDTN